MIDILWLVHSNFWNKKSKKKKNQYLQLLNVRLRTSNDIFSQKFEYVKHK